MMEVKLLLTLFMLSTPTFSVKYGDSRSDQDSFLKGDCSIQSCMNGTVAAALDESTSTVITFVARSEYDAATASFVLKFEHEYENSALKQILSFDVKLLSMDEGANQKCRLNVIAIR